MTADFDIAALYAALDAQREARGLTWQAVAREINGQFAGQFSLVRTRPIAASTITGMRSRSTIEGDGALQMLRWLGRTPESFVPGSVTEGAALPEVPPHEILRFDTKKIYAAMDARRVEHALTWKQVANELGAGTSASLTRYANGGRTGFPIITRIARWLDRPVAYFTRASSW